MSNVIKGTYMLKRFRTAMALAAISLSGVCEGARYESDIHESGGDGAWVFSYLILLFVGAM